MWEMLVYCCPALGSYSEIKAAGLWGLVLMEERMADLADGEGSTNPTLHQHIRFGEAWL